MKHRQHAIPRILVLLLTRLGRNVSSCCIFSPGLVRMHKSHIHLIFLIPINTLPGVWKSAPLDIRPPLVRTGRLWNGEDSIFCSYFYFDISCTLITTPHHLLQNWNIKISEMTIPLKPRLSILLTKVKKINTTREKVTPIPILRIDRTECLPHVVMI